MKKRLRILNSTLLISLLFLSSCNSKKYSQITDSNQNSSDPLLEVDYSKLMAPQNLSFDPAQRILKWDEVNNAAKYELNVDGKIISSNIQKNNYTLPNLFNDETKTQYYLSIRAINEDGTIKSNYTTFLYDMTDATLSSPYSFEYLDDSNEYIINGLNPFFDLEKDSNLVVTEEFNDIPVTGIAANAFKNEKKLIKSMTLSKNIKTIGESAFNNCYISKITLNDGLVEIGDSAFNMAIKLTELTLPSSVERIGESSFAMSRINRLTIQDQSKLQSIGKEAFANTQIKELNVPSTVTSIGESAFYKTKISNLTFGEGIAIEELPKQCFASTSIVEVNIPSSVTKIGESCFSGCNSLKSVLFDEDSKIQFLDEGAFENLGKLSYFGLNSNFDRNMDYSGSSVLNVLDSIQEIGDRTFRNVKFNQINFNASSTLTKIGNNAFSGNTDLTSIQFPKSLMKIGSNAFAENKDLDDISFADGSLLRYVGKDAFLNCNYITKNGEDQRIMVGKVLYAISKADKEEKSITLDASTLAISEGVFSDCVKLETIQLNEGIEVIGDNAFLNCSALKSISFPNSVTSIGNSAFQNCNALNNIDFGNAISSSLTTIGDNAFSSVSEVTSIQLPNNVTSIGKSAFECASNYSLGNVTGKAKMTTFIINAASKLTTIGEKAFSGQVSLTDINIPNQVETLPNSVFYNCAALKNITIDKDSSNLSVIGTSAFENAGVVTINIPACTTKIETKAFKNCKALTNVDFADMSFANSEDKALYNNTFEGCSSLVSITLSPNIETIQANAFLNATKLETINTAATNIDNLAFKNTAFESNAENGFVICNGIIIRYVGTDKEVVLPNGIVGINPSAFSNSTVEVVTIADSLKTIDDSAFEKCTNLKAVKFTANSTLTEIGDSAFKDCKKLEEFQFSKNLIHIGAYAFYNCTSLKSADLSSDYLTVIEEYSFANCNSLFELKLGNGIEEIKKYAFYQNSLTQIVFPQSIKEVGDYAFAYNGKALNNQLSPENWEILTPSLVSINFGAHSNLNLIGKYAFASNYISEIELPKNEGLFLDEYCFLNSSVLLSFTLEEGITITEGIVSGANRLESIELPSEIYLVSLFGGQVSMVPKTLKTVTFSEGSKKVNDHALAGLGMVENVALPSTINEIGEYAFYGCRSITTIDLSNIERIEQNAFNGCTKLSSIKFGNNIEYIGDKALFATGYLNEQESEFVIIDGILIDYNGDNSVVTLPDSVTAIAGGAFSGNQSVEKIILSKNTQYIGNGAFDACYKLENIEIQYEGMVEIEFCTFDTLSSNVSIYVSNKNLSTYQKDIVWSLYADYLKVK